MSNVDHSEIAKFESIANKWWDLEGEFKPLHDINPLRLNYINERVSLAGKNVLDVGCGGGILSEGTTPTATAVIKSTNTVIPNTRTIKTKSQRGPR